MRDDRGERLRPTSLKDLRATLRQAGVGRGFRRGLRRRIPGPIRMTFVCGGALAGLSLGSIAVFDLLRSAFGFELDPVYRIHSFRWWAETLVTVGLFFGTPLFVLGGAAYLVARRRVTARAHAALELGFCGACGYGLEALGSEPDGCVMCPECGAAWRLRA